MAEASKPAPKKKTSTSKKKAATKKRGNGVGSSGRIAAARKGGSRKTEAKADAGRRNGNKGGRPPGSATQRTRAIADKLAKAAGITPLEHMLKALNEDAKEELAAFRLMLSNGDITAKDYAFLKDEIVSRQDWAAEKAAPYIHPRLQSIEHDTGGAHEDGVDAMYDDLANPVIDE